MTIYPVGTPIAAIVYFDRSTKVHFACVTHKGSIWMSKQPSCSQWFQSFSNTEDCTCSMNDFSNWETVTPYDDGKE